jgi:hypothetical protein
VRRSVVAASLCEASVQCAWNRRSEGDGYNIDNCGWSS